MNSFLQTLFEIIQMLLTIYNDDSKKCLRY